MKERKKEGEEDRERKVGEGGKERRKKGRRKGRKKWAHVNGLPCDCQRGPNSTLFFSYYPHQDYTRSIISVSSFHRQGCRDTEGLIFFILYPLANPFALSCQAQCWCHSSPWTTFKVPDEHRSKPKTCGWDLESSPCGPGPSFLGVWG